MRKVNYDLIREIWNCFSQQQHVFLATSEGNQPRVRPVTLIQFRKHLYVATGSDDAKVKQIEKNPKVEFCLIVEKGNQKGTLRAECISGIVGDRRIKANIFNEISFIKEFFKTPEDPKYALLKFKPLSFEYMKPGELQAVKAKPE